MSGGRSTLGWLILVAGLAVPAVLFWRWREQMKTQAYPEASAQGAQPQGAFSGMSSASALPNPVAGGASSTATVSAAPTEVSTAAVSAPVAAASATAQGQEQGPVFAPKSDRDPMLSPVDRKKLLDEMLARDNPVQTRSEQPRRPARPRPESRLKLYGIVATPNGITALINDRVLKAGDKIDGIVVERITTKMVVFRHKNRTFTMKLDK